jgi:hypothetical protein
MDYFLQNQAMLDRPRADAFVSTFFAELRHSLLERGLSVAVGKRL